MFTGIIQAVGHISRLTEGAGGDARVTVAAGGLDLTDAQLGDSIACNGVCLTVVDKTADSFSIDVSGETFSCTIGFAPGDKVNLEKAMRLSDRLGGHLVSGHVDGIGAVVRIDLQPGGAQGWRFRAPRSLMRYIAVKGSICIDGASLTVNGIDDDCLEVTLIPHTLAATSFGARAVGDAVNLEVDLIARHLERLQTGAGA